MPKLPRKKKVDPTTSVGGNYEPEKAKTSITTKAFGLMSRRP